MGDRDLKVTKVIEVHADSKDEKVLKEAKECVGFAESRAIRGIEARMDGSDTKVFRAVMESLD